MEGAAFVATKGLCVFIAVVVGRAAQLHQQELPEKITEESQYDQYEPQEEYEAAGGYQAPIYEPPQTKAEPTPYFENLGVPTSIMAV